MSMQMQPEDTEYLCNLAPGDGAKGSMIDVDFSFLMHGSLSF